VQIRSECRSRIGSTSRVHGSIASIYAQRLAGHHDRSLGSVGKSTECCTASSEVARHIDNWYPGIGNTIVQLFRVRASDSSGIRRTQNPPRREWAYPVICTRARMRCTLFLSGNLRSPSETSFLSPAVTRALQRLRDTFHDDLLIRAENYSRKERDHDRTQINCSTHQQIQNYSKGGRYDPNSLYTTRQQAGR